MKRQTIHRPRGHRTYRERIRINGKLRTYDTVLNCS
jgi:hypothetical protein